MSNKMQTAKNIELTQKLIEYLLNGDDVPELPENVSYVPFSNKDKVLNKANEELLEVISQEGTYVVKAEEPSSSEKSWKITPINF